MIESKTIVNSEGGLHMRPSLFISQIVNSSKSKVIISNDRYEANADSIMELVMLTAGDGEELTIKAEGADEEEVVHSIIDIINRGNSSL